MMTLLQIYLDMDMDYDRGAARRIIIWIMMRIINRKFQLPERVVSLLFLKPPTGVTGGKATQI